MQFEQDYPYPQYPTATENVTPYGEYPKLPFSDLVKYYDMLRGLGLYALPKYHDRKYPVSKYWSTSNTEKLEDRQEALNWQTRDNVSGWCVATGERSNRLIVVDFDTHEIERNGVDAFMLYRSVQDMSPSKFVLKSPANGVHIYYRLPEHLEMIGNVAPPVKGVDLRGEGGQVVSLGGFNRYDEKAADKGVPEGHCDTYRLLDDGDYTEIPIMSDKLYSWLTLKLREKVKPKNVDLEAAGNYGKTEMGLKRLEEHRKQAKGEQERIVLECLDHILDKWSDEKTYDEWLAVWMSAHFGASGSPTVRDYLLSHPKIYWSDGQTGKMHFRHAWDTHQHRDDGYTVATLFWLAKQAGWLTRTGYEIPDSIVEKVRYRYVSEWMEDLDMIPNRLLLMSQTGTGKTHNIRNLWDRLDKPKTVVFVPSIKLATELAMTLKNVHGMPVTLYRDNNTGHTLSTEELTEAHVLVTTLQTFASKVNNPMSEYGLVYVEESDQLLAQFSRGGGGIYSSHVSEMEARRGFAVIRDAMENSGYVWYVDATMTSVTNTVAEATKGSHSLTIIKNTFVKDKAPVRIVSEKGLAYQAVLRGLEKGQRVVVACDTATTAEEVNSTMKNIGVLDGKNSIVITRTTELHPSVVEFMTDVNRYAADYDLVCYNSVMASGVSITEVEPDLIVQICTYLTPRVNLQMLNRYRNQKKVVCYYRSGENLYAEKAGSLLDMAKERALLESQLINIPLAARNSDAELRALTATISVADQSEQERSAREFYIELLEGDGREVDYAEGTPLSGIIKHTIEGVRSMRKEMRDQLKATWHTVPPIDRDRPAKPEYTNVEVAAGEIHAEIEKALRGNIPDLNEVTPEEVYRIVYSFKRTGFFLTAFIRQEKALRRSEIFMADKGRALTTLMSNVTAIKVLSLVGLLYHDLSEVLDEETLAKRSKLFMIELTKAKSSYDAIVNRRYQKFDEVYEKYDTIEKRSIAFSKILLSKIGLKQRSTRANRKGGVASYEYTIDNLQDAYTYLEWRNADNPAFVAEIDTDTNRIDRLIESRSDAIEVFRAMDEERQERVMELLENTDFKTAVTVAVDEMEGTW